MKIFEVFEDEAPNSEYHDRLQSKVLDYLTTITGMGVETVYTKQVTSAFNKQGIDLRDDQLGELLDGTGFSVEGDKIMVATSDEMDEPDLDPEAETPSMPDQQDMTDMKVSNMASNAVQNREN